jgi:DNA-binding XRE family transcriptional regulator
MSKKESDVVTPGARAYLQWKAELAADPAYPTVYAQEAAKSELWLQLVEARQKAGLTQKQMAQRLGVSQAQIARIEKAGYDAYTLNTLRKYVAALGSGFSIEVHIHTPEPDVQSGEPMPLPDKA